MEPQSGERRESGFFLPQSCWELLCHIHRVPSKHLGAVSDQASKIGQKEEEEEGTLRLRILLSIKTNRVSTT